MFRTIAYLSPLLAGFGVAAALALTDGAPLRRRAAVAGAVLGGLLLLLLLFSFTESVGLWLPVAIVLASLSILVSGTYLLVRELGAPREPAQLLASLVVVLLLGSVFAFGPLIKAAANAGASGETLHARITLAMDVNPLFVLGYSVFDTEILVRLTFYRMGLADFQHGVPRWTSTSTGYALAGFALAGASLGVNRLRRRRVD